MNEELVEHKQVVIDHKRPEKRRETVGHRKRENRAERERRKREIE